MGCKGNVYDVSANEVYKGEGTYAIFGGKEASVALAKMNFNAENFYRSKFNWKKDLSDKELGVLNEWDVFFEKRYPLMGYVYDEDIDKNEKSD